MFAVSLIFKKLNGKSLNSPKQFMDPEVLKHNKKRRVGKSNSENGDQSKWRAYPIDI